MSISEIDFIGLVRQLREFELNLNTNVEYMNQSINNIYVTLRSVDPKTITTEQMTQFRNLIQKRESFYLTQMHEYKQLLDKLGLCIKNQMI